MVFNNRSPFLSAFHNAVSADSDLTGVAVSSSEMSYPEAHGRRRIRWVVELVLTPPSTQRCSVSEHRTWQAANRLTRRLINGRLTPRSNGEILEAGIWAIIAAVCCSVSFDSLVVHNAVPSSFYICRLLTEERQKRVILDVYTPQRLLYARKNNLPTKGCETKCTLLGYPRAARFLPACYLLHEPLRCFSPT